MYATCRLRRAEAESQGAAGVLPLQNKHLKVKIRAFDSSPAEALRGQTEFGTATALLVLLGLIPIFVLVNYHSEQLLPSTQVQRVETSSLTERVTTSSPAHEVQKRLTGRCDGLVYKHCAGCTSQNEECDQQTGGMSLKDLQDGNTRAIERLAQTRSWQSPAASPFAAVLQKCEEDRGASREKFCSALAALPRCATLQCYEGISDAFGGNTYVRWALRPYPFDRSLDSLELSLQDQNWYTDATEEVLQEIQTCGDEGMAIVTRGRAHLAAFAREIHSIYTGAQARQSKLSMAAYLMQLDGTRGPVASDIVPVSDKWQPPLQQMRAWDFDDWVNIWLQDAQGVSAAAELVKLKPAAASLYTALHAVHTAREVLTRYAPVADDRKAARRHTDCARYAYKALPLREGDWMAAALSAADARWQSKIDAIFGSVRSQLLHISAGFAGVYGARVQQKLRNVKLVVAGSSSPWVEGNGGGQRLRAVMQKAAAADTAVELVELFRNHVRGVAKPYGAANRRYEPAVIEHRSSANAEYRPLDNTLVLNIGLAPYVSVFGSAAKQYASVGFIIGHELSHSFDTNGIWFDELGTPAAFGNVRQQIAALRQFQCDVNYANAMGVDGFRTLNENFADKFGLRAAFGAANISTRAETVEFLQTFSRLWCNVAGGGPRDTHAPPIMRAQMATSVLQSHISDSICQITLKETCS